MLTDSHRYCTISAIFVGIPHNLSPASFDPFAMQPVPLPSHIHYELLLQLLERETARSVDRGTEEHRQLQELVATLRRGLAIQKQLEATCDRKHIPIEYHWSLNQPTPADRSLPAES